MFGNHSLRVLSWGLCLAVSGLAGQGVVTPFVEQPPAPSGAPAGAGDSELEHAALKARIEYLKEQLAAAEAELAAREGSPEEEAPSAGVEALGVPTGALVVVSSDESEGSGFIGRIKGRTFFITNIHVLGAARGARIATVEGTPVELGPVAFLSKQRDVAIVPIEWDGPVMEVSPSLSFDEVAIGQAVSVMGNSSGARVATRLEGTIRGIGPDELEVSAKFVPGNSGSPIVHDELGAVIGVASHLRDYSKRSKWTEDSELGDIRRFGFRLDGETEWEQFTLEELHRQSEIFHRFEDRTFALWHISYMLEYRSQLMTQYRSHESLGYLFENIDENFDWDRGTGSGNNRQILMRFLTRMATEVYMDLKETEEALDVSFYKMRFNQVSPARKQVLHSVENFKSVRM